LSPIESVIIMTGGKPPVQHAGGEIVPDVPSLPEDLVLRPYGHADLGALRDLVNMLQDAECAIDASRVHWADGGAAYAEGLLQSVAENDGLIVLALAADAPIGMMACWRAEDATDITVTPAARAHLYVSELVVAPEQRGRRIGGALLAEAERHGRRLGLTQMTVGVLAANQPARRLYARSGFADFELLLRKGL
jgi:ribosomal protein S18 acetylase RimI-like enzyme